jgi:hypothetical protein
LLLFLSNFPPFAFFPDRGYKGFDKRRRRENIFVVSISETWTTIVSGEEIKRKAFDS